MSKLSPYEVKRKEYRLDKADASAIEVTFTINGPTKCAKKFSDKSDAQRECDLLNQVYDKGYQDGMLVMHNNPKLN